MAGHGVKLAQTLPKHIRNKMPCEKWRLQNEEEFGAGEIFSHASGGVEWEYFLFSASQVFCAPPFHVYYSCLLRPLRPGPHRIIPSIEVSEKYKQDERVWIIREEQGIYVLFAKCTHLGCTPRWLAAEDKFKCPCHGSGFYKSGMNFEGPAPRPLDRFGVSLNETGQLVVDKSKVFKMRPGTEPEEQYPESVLKA